VQEFLRLDRQDRAPRLHHAAHRERAPDHQITELLASPLRPGPPGRFYFYNAVMKRRGNLYLVGMMGAGKSTIGRLLARRLKLRFIDCDDEIERRCGVAVPLIFDIEGEAGFRTRESQVLEELTAMQNVVLATGGGAVLDAENRRRLAAGGTVVYLCAPPPSPLYPATPPPPPPLLSPPPPPPP